MTVNSVIVPLFRIVALLARRSAFQDREAVVAQSLEVTRVGDVLDAATRGGGDGLDNLRGALHRGTHRIPVVILRRRALRRVEARVHHRERLGGRRRRRSQSALRHPGKRVVRLRPDHLVHVVRHATHRVEELSDVSLERVRAVVRVRRDRLARGGFLLDDAAED